MPVEVRVMLLKEREVYDNLDFETVWQRGEEALSTDLVKASTITVFPGKLTIHPMKSKPGVAYVAVVAIYRKPKGRQWQHLFDVREQNRRCATKDSLHTIIHVLLKDNRVERAATEPEEEQ
jgi:type VI secretion system VasD/TssJ family lipoprotein